MRSSPECFPGGERIALPGYLCFFWQKLVVVVCLTGLSWHAKIGRAQTMSDHERNSFPQVAERPRLLIGHQRRKMARSAHAYVRGATRKFYEWLEQSNGHAIPEGPPIWICGDCHVGNILWTEGDATHPGGPHFVDFDDSRMGPAVQDIWMLLSGDRIEMQQQLADVIAGYEDFAEFDRRELYLVEALRTLRLIHYSAWIARRWHDPAFPAAFPWFDKPRYWEDRILELREQIAAMQEPPLAV